MLLFKSMSFLLNIDIVIMDSYEIFQFQALLKNKNDKKLFATYGKETTNGK